MRWFGGLVIAITLFAIVPTTATATMLHVPDGSFSGPGKGSGQLEDPIGVGVNDVTHEVFVADRGNRRVLAFSEDGSSVLCEISGVSPVEPFIEPVEVAVDNSENAADPSAGDIYVVDRGRGTVDKFTVNKITSVCEAVGVINGETTKDGRFEGGDAEPRSIVGIAVDPSGTIWAATGNGKIYGFTDEVESPWNGQKLSLGRQLALGFAVDAKKDFFINVGTGFFAEINELGQEVEKPIGGDTTAYSVALELSAKRSPEIYLDSRESVDVFEVGGKAIESFGAGELAFSNGIAVDSSNGMVYVTDQTLDKVFRYEGVILPTVSVGAPSEQQPTALTLNGAVDPEESQVTGCRFEYETASEFAISKKYGRSAPCLPANLGEGSAPVAVHAHISGLTPETEYDYRLVAENAAPIPAEAKATFFTGPLLEGSATVGVSDVSATMQAEVDPNGGDTHYLFEYGTTESYGSIAPVAAPGRDIGSAPGEQTVQAHVQGLQPGTVYHYRLLVEQAGETFEEPSPDHTFITQRSGEAGGASDDRSWELVSPAQKQGAGLELFEQGGQVQAAADGSGVTYLASGASLGNNPKGRVTLSQELSNRTSPGRWETTDLALPGRLPENEQPAVGITTFQMEYRLFSPDLSSSLVEPQESGTPLLSPKASEQTLYLRTADGQFLPLVDGENVVGGPIDEPIDLTVVPAEWEMQLLAASRDLKDVIFKTPMALTGDAVDEEKIAGHKYVSGDVQANVYEWSNGTLQLVNVLPPFENAKKEIVEEVAHGPEPTFPGVRLAGMTNAGGRWRGGASRNMSSDGRWIPWTWGEPYTSEAFKKYRGLYLRDTKEKVTMRVGGASAIYQTMSSDGSKLFYIEKGDLYELDTESRTATDLTGGATAEVQEPVANVSEDGASIYFVAKGVLATGGQLGQNNLYRLHDVSGAWTTTYIATLSAEDEASWSALGIYLAPYLPGITSRVSPNGRFFTFMSDRPLTGYDNRDAVSRARDEEVFLYDADTEKIACVSCAPTRARPNGLLDTSSGEIKLIDRQQAWTLGGGHWIAAILPGWNSLSADPDSYQPRFLSDDGRVFFDSVDALVPQDTNGLSDVYEFEPVGIGGCIVDGDGYQEAAQGCVSLLSSGTARAESAYYDSSESGDDVFFDSTAKLVGEDFDTGYDVYDAHVCTGAAPCPVYPTQSPPCDSGDSCKAPPSLQPEIFGAPPSATFNGVGNVAPVPAATKPKPRSLTNAQKLAKALARCHKRHPAKRRTACERQARRRYPVKKQSRKATRSKGRGRA